MNSKDFKYILVNDIKIAYTDKGSGKALLFIHGFASFSYTWQQLISLLPQNYRFITIDLKSFGYSEKICDDNLSPFDQAIIIKEFIRLLKLKNIIIIGHSMGGAVSAISLFDEEFRKKISALILIDSAGLFEKLPDFIDELSSLSPDNPILKIADPRALALHVLHQVFSDKEKVSERTLRVYSENLKSENYRKCIISAARQIGIANEKSFRKKLQEIKIPSVIIWGDNDKVISLSDAYLFRDDLKCELFIIDKCGHSPQEECPEKTAEIIIEFLNSLNKKDTSNPENINREAIHHLYHNNDKIRMRKIIDKWSFGSVLLMGIVKTLQFMRKIGFKVKEDGWRKICGTFLRNEQSKFMLATFRLNYYDGYPKPQTITEARTIIIKRLLDFLSKTPATHWSIRWSPFKTHRDLTYFTDIVEAEFSGDGKLRKLIPHFDNTRRSFPHLDQRIIKKVLRRFIIFFNYNESALKKDHIKAWFILRSLQFSAKQIRVSHAGRHELKLLIRRLVNASFITFEVIRETDKDQRLKKRLKTPNTKLSKHPGFGLLNIKCRLLEDLSECDIWVQYHHVPVDGLPMQEMMHSLKAELGDRGKIIYPPFHSIASKPEIIYFGNMLFRARIFIDFENFLKFRKFLNEKYVNQMHGQATVASLIIWGLSQRKFFRNIKFLFPVDTSVYNDFPQERSLGILSIRPVKFYNRRDPFEGFLNFQHEFNRRLFLTRIGKSETYEFFELVSLLHPSISYIFNKIFPGTIGEVIGTAGITILKDAEMFVSPSTEIQRHGFMAIGKMDNLTEDGKLIGAVNICGTRKQLHEYFLGLGNLTHNLPKMLGIPFEQ
ncbi:MAG: hypothetical protein A2X47_00575 [Lentisphaerae bacterium GWF2_38_69]|nr:MAG: hypothetical protein A2X47_00575 [Lentisphaerae bacterium GWF2_38_69]